MRFRKQLTPNFLTTCELREVAAIVLFTCVSHKRRRAHSLTNDERATQFSVVALLLIPDNTFNGTGTATAVLLWPLNACPTSLGLFLLPLFGFFYGVKVPSFSGAKSTHR